MIEIIPTLLTPLMLAMSPSTAPTHQPDYDWQSQRAIVSEEDSGTSYSNGTMRGTQSFVAGKLTIDDWNQD